MSAPEKRAPQTYDTIVVVGGGCYGSYYVRQLLRAAAAGAIAARRVVVVDHDPGCRVTLERVDDGKTDRSLVVQIVVQEWREFFAHYLSAAAAHPDRHANDAIVPSPLMPHLMGEWIVDRTRSAFPHRSISTMPLERLPAVPWERAGEGGTHYVSFATWMCPVNCIEPRICPHTRDVRTWSMPEELVAYARGEAAGTRPIVLATLHCRHRAYGVGMFDTLEVVDANARVEAAATRGAAEVIIGTVSHCHGALTRLLIDAPNATADSPAL
jgi:hypothetical protein